MELYVTLFCIFQVKVKNLFSRVWLFATPWTSPGLNTGVGSLSLLQGIFPTQGSNPGLPHCMWILYQLSHKGRPRILVWVAYPFSSGSSRPRNRTGVSYIAGRFFTNWVIREATDIQIKFLKHSSNCIISKSLISGKTCIAACSSHCNWLHWRLLFTTSESMFDFCTIMNGIQKTVMVLVI